MSGVALMSVGNLLFAAVVILANWITTYFYLKLPLSVTEKLTGKVEFGDGEPY